MAALTDEEKILELAADLRAYGVDPVDLLRQQVKAEGYCERRLRADDPESLADVLRANKVSAFPDVFESPTFRKSLRLIRLDACHSQPKRRFSSDQAGMSACVGVGRGMAVAQTKPGGRKMLWTIVVILLVLWALGFFGGYAVTLGMGGLIHILLVIAIVVVIIRVIQGRRVL
jgi:hypothetical protein